MCCHRQQLSEMRHHGSLLGYDALLSPSAASGDNVDATLDLDDLVRKRARLAELLGRVAIDKFSPSRAAPTARHTSSSVALLSRAIQTGASTLHTSLTSHALVPPANTHPGERELVPLLRAVWEPWVRRTVAHRGARRRGAVPGASSWPHPQPQAHMRMGATVWPGSPWSRKAVAAKQLARAAAVTLKQAAFCGWQSATTASCCTRLRWAREKAVRAAAGVRRERELQRRLELHLEKKEVGSAPPGARLAFLAWGHLACDSAQQRELTGLEARAARLLREQQAAAHLLAASQVQVAKKALCGEVFSAWVLGSASLAAAAAVSACGNSRVQQDQRCSPSRQSSWAGSRARGPQVPPPPRPNRWAALYEEGREPC